ncbi:MULTISPECIES: DUF4114 domain-containing protein [unclassified Roseofilum]|uniref:DUF4114 domain-containing protein n=1 Tax=unclassified Roseofilum TaxID=2620099 RepID=UPI001B014DE0|nr:MULTISPECIES: DUF4114 domain-containing protein [unclassified Roseofilum]MBP0008536.1 DUF4114 domain-containing protein [Roseofilum sp. Belize Diploria]MBP0033799.1 DUF4114 domain-containing protein [Roseofilum sp. Belize BBD 4]
MSLLYAPSAHGLSLRSDLFNTFNGMVRQERLQIEDSAASLLELDPATLQWTEGADSVDVFFINEGAIFRNQLFYSANGGAEQMVFDDIASPNSIIPEANGPMALGEGVSLGTFTGNTSLNFMIKADGAQNDNGHVYGADASLNPDGLQHVVAYEYFDDVEQENWVILGFEDLFGVHIDEGGWSDRDFNDVVIAVRGITGNGMPIPEPSTTAAILGLAALGMAGLGKSNRES